MFSQQPHQALIESLSHDGRGIAHIEGKTVFIAGALPGETVTFTYVKRRSQFDEGQVTSFGNASPDRVVPICSHFHMCGGCTLQHLNPAKQVLIKQQTMLDHLKHVAGITPDTILPPLTGNHKNYRHKARLSVKYVAKKNKVLVGFHEKNQAQFIADIDECPVLGTPVDKLISPLKTLLSDLPSKHHIPQIEIAIADDATSLVFRNVQALSDESLQSLREFGKAHNVYIYLQPRGIDSIYLLWPENTSPLRHYELPSFQLTLAFHPTDFTQVNAMLNREMVNQAIRLLSLQKTDNVLDLFCGIGNFTLPIATKCERVIGVEGNQSSVERAKNNAELNHIKNTEFYAADLTKSIQSEPWAKQSFDKILLDPPRTGAEEIVAELKNFGAKIIVYVSCDPATLARDAALLIKQGYQLRAAGIIDMFPHTRHVESMAYFEDNNG